MRRAIEVTAFIAMLIGVGGCAGAIEMGESLFKPLAMALVGIAVMIFMGASDEEIDIKRSIHDASYPSMLKYMRR